MADAGTRAELVEVAALRSVVREVIRVQGGQTEMVVSSPHIGRRASVVEADVLLGIERSVFLPAVWLVDRRGTIPVAHRARLLYLVVEPVDQLRTGVPLPFVLELHPMPVQCRLERGSPGAIGGHVVHGRMFLTPVARDAEGMVAHIPPEHGAVEPMGHVLDRRRARIARQRSWILHIVALEQIRAHVELPLRRQPESQSQVMVVGVIAARMRRSSRVAVIPLTVPSAEIVEIEPGCQCTANVSLHLALAHSAGRHLHTTLQRTRAAHRNQVDHACHGLRTIKGRRRPLQHLDAGHASGGHHAQLVDDGRNAILQHQRLQRFAHHRAIGRESAHAHGRGQPRILLDVHAGGLAQQIGQLRMGRRLDLSARHHLDALGRVLHGHFGTRAGDHHVVLRGIAPIGGIARCLPCRCLCRRSARSLRHGSRHRTEAEQQPCQPEHRNGMCHCRYGV